MTSLAHQGSLRHVRVSGHAVSRESLLDFPEAAFLVRG